MKRLRMRATLADTPTIDRQIDSYVHLAVTLGHPLWQVMTPPPLYWRLVDPRFNLVEIGIDRHCGRLVSVTIPLYTGRLFAASAGMTDLPVEEIPGVPVAERDPWAGVWEPGRDPYDNSADFLDVPGRCRFELGAGYLRVVLFSDPVRRRVVTSGQVAWDFNASDELCAVSVAGLTAEEEAVLEDTIGRSATPCS